MTGRALVCGAGSGPTRVNVEPPRAVPVVTRAPVLPRLWELLGGDDIDDREDSTRLLMRALAPRAVASYGALAR